MPAVSLEVVIAVGFLVLVGIETVVSWRHNLDFYEFRDTAANFALALGDLFMAAAMKGAFLLLFALLHRFAPVDFGHTWYGWVLLIVVNDFVYYVFHRLGHRSRFMWAFHVTHHSSQKYNFSVAIRLNLLIFPLHFLFMLPLALMGFRPEAILVVNSITTLYQLWVHTELVGKLGVLDRVFNTPSNHRVHHGSNAQYLDRNYGAMFIFWDHLFGTYEPEVERPIYGLTKNVDSYNPVILTLHEVRAMARDALRPGPLRQRMMYLFGPPGWQPPGATRAPGGEGARPAHVVRPAHPAADSEAWPALAPPAAVPVAAAVQAESARSWVTAGAVAVAAARLRRRLRYRWWTRARGAGSGRQASGGRSGTGMMPLRLRLISRFRTAGGGMRPALRQLPRLRAWRSPVGSRVQRQPRD